MTFNSLILIWFDQSKRNLPWRQTRNPYKVWLSEIILQQTRVSQGSGYYDRFLQAFPSVLDLAKADEKTVLKLWQGLGYYSRARNLHFTARQIVKDYSQQFPSEFSGLKKLKGVGDYTAAAIASICFDQAVPAIDGNAYRVYSRYFDIDIDISTSKAKKYFFDLGLEIIDKNRPGDFNQAVMELGATVCTPRNPKCETCPVSFSCAALAENKVTELPVKSKKVKVKNRFFQLLYVVSDKHVLLNKRTGNDIWKNLYMLPLIEKEKLSQDQLKEITQLSFELVHEEKHILTHQNLYLTFWKTEVNVQVMSDLSLVLNAEMIPIDELEMYPIPRPLEKFLF